MLHRDIQNAIDKAADLLIQSRYPVTLVGAGMSVESGIPPFRGPGGIWTKYGEPDMNGYQDFLRDPKQWWLDRVNDIGPMAEFRAAFNAAKPNPGHYALADLERLGRMKYIITQNVDDLHRKAGSKSMGEIHGNATKLRCVGCGQRWDREGFEVYDYPPICIDCGGVIKSDTVMFGEPIPMSVLLECQEETDRCDCMLLIGTTAEVYPAAAFPREVKANRGDLIEINPYATVISHYCDVVLRASSGEVLPRIVDKVKSVLGEQDQG